VADPAEELARLIARFWTWRARTQPESGDDLPRVRRPPGWVGDWSGAAIAARRRRLAEFTARYEALDLAAQPVAVRVDARLLGSALARVRWELDLVRGWQRDPRFYLDQSLLPVFHLLLAPPPFSDERAAAIIGALRHVPVLLRQGSDNLAGHATGAFTRHTQGLLVDGPARLEQAMTALAPYLPGRYGAALVRATEDAAAALTAFRDRLGELATTPTAALGPAALGFFLHRVALLPYPVDRLRDLAAQELHRAVALEAILRRAHRPPAPAPAGTGAEFVARQHRAELDVRRFYAEQALLDLPDGLRHYRFALMPAYLAPLTWLGLPHHIGSADRPDDDAVRYVHPPRPDLPYFQRAKVLDPRTGIVHEGVHAHQFALSWRHPDPARRHFYDSTPNEGLAFYHEELMLLCGLFDGAPASAVFIANSMRLRALRVEVDLGLARGELSLERAAERLAVAVPLDRATAWEEAVFFAGNPGQGLSYQVGKHQILDLLAAAGGGDETFDLRRFHNRLWREANVPLALQRWELLGQRDHLDEADRLAALAESTVDS
jgi:hypothetical protein